MRSIRFGVWLAIVTVACTSDANDPTTTESIPSTTQTTVDQTTTSTATITTAPTTSSSVPDDPWSADYPLDAQTVDDLPSVLADKIDAAEPDPDLTIEGPDDLERWVTEWLDWFSWVNANPAEGIGALEHAVIPAGTFYEETAAALQSRVDEGTRLLGYAFVPNELTATFDEFFERGELLRMVVVGADTIPRYVVDESGSVVEINEPLGGETTLHLSLRFREGEGEWVLENIDVVG
jgi:hypothetical protein